MSSFRLGKLYLTGLAITTAFRFIGYWGEQKTGTDGFQSASSFLANRPGSGAMSLAGVEAITGNWVGRRCLS